MMPRSARSSGRAAATSSWSAPRSTAKRNGREIDLRNAGGAGDKQYYLGRGKPRHRQRGITTGGAATLNGRTYSASAASATSRSRPANGDRMEVICDGDTITNIVNGYVVNVGTKSSLTKGKILFQSEGAEALLPQDRGPPLVK